MFVLRSKYDRLRLKLVEAKLRIDNLKNQINWFEKCPLSFDLLITEITDNRRIGITPNRLRMSTKYYDLFKELIAGTRKIWCNPLEFNGIPVISDKKILSGWVLEKVKK